MSNLLITSDQHFRHKKIWSFRDDAGSLIRPFAASMEEGDELMVEAWNRVVKRRDIVLHLGDIVVHRSGLELLARLNGQIILVRGNHDRFNMKDYAPYVHDLRGSHQIDRVMVSHIPLHPESIPQHCIGNIHGHLHEKIVTLSDGAPDPRYLNASIERIGLEPVGYETLRDAI